MRWISFFLLIIFSGCATIPSQKESEKKTSYLEPKIIEKEGIYHRVKKGETLWRISKLYNVEMEKILEANKLRDTSKIFQGQLIFIPKSGQSIPKEGKLEKGFIWPIKGKIISYFGTQRYDGTINRGIDIMPQESSKVLAVKSGKVIFSSDKVKGLGKTVIIEHNDQIYSIYGNNSEVFVQIGQEVNQGEPIALAEKGILHFEIRKGHIPQNPLYFLP